MERRDDERAREVWIDPEVRPRCQAHREPLLPPGYRVVPLTAQQRREFEARFLPAVLARVSRSGEAADSAPVREPGRWIWPSVLALLGVIRVIQIWKPGPLDLSFLNTIDGPVLIAAGVIAAFMWIRRKLGRMKADDTSRG